MPTCERCQMASCQIGPIGGKMHGLVMKETQNVLQIRKTHLEGQPRHGRPGLHQHLESGPLLLGDVTAVQHHRAVIVGHGQ